MPASASRYSPITGSSSSAAGTSRSQAAVISPSVPSEPTSSDFRSYAATSFRSGPPNRTISPGGTTASIPVTQLPVTPYLNACGPPALHAMLPPSCEISAAPGSGGNRSPLSRASRCTAPVVTPASTCIRQSSGSNWRTLFSRSKPITMPPSTGTAPPASPVPPPRAVSGTSCS